jgi:carbon-monoxide dehydrogenase small subunit
MTNSHLPQLPRRLVGADPVCGPDMTRKAAGDVLRLWVNGRLESVVANPLDRLSHILREHLGLTGLKEGCCEGECGVCTVLIDDQPVASCLMLGFQAEGAQITTIEGLARGAVLSDLQQAFLTHGGVQCGYCTPGMVMAAEGHLRANPAGDRDAIRHALAGNICRCTGFELIVDAVEDEAARRRTATGTGA